MKGDDAKEKISIPEVSSRPDSSKNRSCQITAI